MAERDIFSFDIHANNQNAKKALEELKQLAGEVSQASGNLTASPALNKNFSSLVKEMADAQNKYTELRDSMESEISINAGIVYDSRSAEDAKKKARDTINSIRKDLESARKDFMVMNNEAMKTFTNYERTTGKRANVVPDFSTYQNQPNATQKSRNFVNRTNKSVESETREALRIGNSALGSKYINNNNASNYKRLTDNLLSEDVQGAPIQDIISGKKIEPKPGSTRQKITYAREEAKERRGNLYNMMEETAPRDHANRMNDINERFNPGIQKYQEQIQGLENEQEENGSLDPAKMKELEQAYDEHTRLVTKLNQTREEEMTRFKLQMSAFRDEFKDTKDVINKSSDALDALDESAKKLSEQLTEVSSGNIRQKADRDEWAGRLSERATSIGLAVAGASAYSVASNYSQGKQTVDGMREDSLNVGYRTGDYDFRGIRQDYMEQGAPQGWKGQDMLAFSESILGSLGYINQDNLTGNMQNVADFSKFSGAGQEASTAYTESLFSTGGITTADQARAIQEGFIGGIKASGMEGREKEQLTALTAINDNIYRGREASEEEINSRNAMTSVLAGTGNRGLQGENLADFMTGADESIKNADAFSNMGMLLGVGTDEEFSNSDWMYQYMKTQEQGFSPENYNKIISNLTPMTDGSPEAVASELKNLTGVNTGVDALRDFVAKYPNGVPIGEESEKLLQELADSGSTTLDNNEEAYMESGDQSAQAQEAYFEKMKSLLNDNEMIDSLNGLKQEIGDWSSDSAGRAMGTTLTTGVGAGIGAALTGAVSTMLGTAGLKVFGKTFMGANTPVGNTLSKAKGFFKGGTGTGAGLGAVDDVAGASKGLLNPNIVNGTSMADDALSAGKGLLSSGKGMLSKGASMLGKIAPWLAVGTSALEIATADDKVRETGKQAGGLGGAWAGTTAGSAIGTAILPGIGTAIGAGIGGIAGWFGGSSLGDKAGEGISNAISGDDESAEEPKVRVKGAYATSDYYQDSMNTIGSQEEQANTSAKVQAEQLREDNIAKETENLSKWESLLSDIRKLLQMSASQNGIIGAMTGLKTGSGSGTGSQKAVGDGQYWTNSDLTKHDLGSTSTELTAEDLNKWINAKTSEDSVMRGMGEAFMKAGQESGLDPRYLVAHSAHETAWGTSNIAKDKGNMYGIGAFDASPYASSYGYDNTEAGIVEGAKWIKDNYYDKGQTDLTKMHEAGYATDPGWADKIGNTMKGAEAYTKPSQEVTVNTTVNYSGSGDPEADGARLANSISGNISTAFKQERIRP